MQEWARQENEYADMHGPQEELLTTEDLQNFRRVLLSLTAISHCSGSESPCAVAKK